MLTDARQLVLASNNSGKLIELQALFAPLRVSLIAQSSMGVLEAPEPYHTFIENALTKARHACQQTGLPAMADDAGLCVDAFGGLPGVATADYAVQHGLAKGADNNVTALLSQMIHLNHLEQRGAALVSTLVALRSATDPEPLIAVGRVTGQIAFERIGANGFGFDPVFYIPQLGQTFAQLPSEQKNKLSHRGQASTQMLLLIRNRWKWHADDFAKP